MVYESKFVEFCMWVVYFILKKVTRKSRKKIDYKKKLMFELFVWDDVYYIKRI